MRLRVTELAESAGGFLTEEPRAVDVSSFTIDSRMTQPGGCFVALEGDRDGHDFVAEAFAAGAALAIVRRRVDARGPQLVVDDPLLALGRVAAVARNRLDASVVGITGSVGKTATKDLAAAAIETERRVHGSLASYNNEAGVPLTLLSAPDDVEVVVCEMGARRIGDLTYLSKVARPDVGAITSIEMAHAGPLGGLTGITRAKGELIEHLPSSGVAVLSATIRDVAELAARTSARVLRVAPGEAGGRGASSDAGADVIYRDVRLDASLRPTFELDTPWGGRTVTLDVRGAHQATNAAMAAAIALASGVALDAVVEGLARAHNAPHRMELHRTVGAATVLDDTYNANPASVSAALHALAHLDARRRIAVLGEMLELGAESARCHRELGRLASELGIDWVVLVGERADPVGEGVEPGTRVSVVADRDAATKLLRAEAREGDAILIKASRAVGLEAVVASLLEEAS